MNEDNISEQYRKEEPDGFYIITNDYRERKFQI